MIHQTADLSLKNLCIDRNEQQILHHLTLHCHLGQVWQIIGPNGSGKSSLLHVLAGLSAARRGRMQWQNQPLLSQHSLYLSHTLNLKASLTVRENLQLFLSLQPPRLATTLTKALIEFDLESLQNRFIHTLSAGQQRRVNLAKLALSTAPLWLLDEPFTALDQDQCAKFLTRIEQFVLQQGLVLFTSHQTLTFQQLQCQYYYLEERQ